MNNHEDLSILDEMECNRLMQGEGLSTYARFESEVDFVQKIYASVEVENGVARIIRWSNNYKPSEIDLEIVRKYTAFNCQRSLILHTSTTF